MAKMTFDERFGELPVSLLRKIKKLNVSQSDFFGMEDLGLSFEDMSEHLDRYTVNGMYQAPWPIQF